METRESNKCALVTPCSPAPLVSQGPAIDLAGQAGMEMLNTRAGGSRGRAGGGLVWPEVSGASQ